MFSDSGRSYAFDHRASGFGRGEGVGCIILKPLDAALSAGDSVRAVIAGSGINQDGRTRGITLPNSAAQESLIRSVYKNAHIDPSDTGYVEAHGTGTRAGDPLEASALHAVFGKGRTPKEPLFVGSVKTNVGHTEGASGVISVIKTAMMLEKGFVLPNCGFQKANDEIPVDKWNIKACLCLAMNPSTVPLTCRLDSQETGPLASREKICQHQQFRFRWSQRSCGVGAIFVPARRWRQR